MGERAEFLRAFMRAPVATGAIAPSSAWLARRMIEGLDLASAGTVVEAGPGTGAFTGAILGAAGTNSWVLGVEVNPAFAAGLEARYSRLHVVNDSIEHLPRHLARLGRPPADVVLSGLPWAILHPRVQRRLLRGIADGLADGGVFVTFGYVHCSALPWSRGFHRLLAEDFVDLRPSPVIWRNLPPAIVYRFRKRAGHTATSN